MTGHVHVVGAGPGDPGLLTRRAYELLQTCDVVLTDRLVSAEVLALIPASTEVRYVGKTPRGPASTQDDINAELVSRALAGQIVVRLKGGDPFVFGRGGEEVVACVAAGVESTVVPGVSAAFGVPASAGIPVTHRGVSQSVTVVSGHVPPGHPSSTVDWAGVALTGGTITVLMGVDTIGKIATTLVEHGRRGDTAVAVVSEGTTPRQRTLRTTLDDVARDIADAGITSPAVIVIGEVAGLPGAGL